MLHQLISNCVLLRAGHGAAPPLLSPQVGYLVGVKRNAERYMFQEPRPPVDAVRARIRESLFSFRHVQSDVNFLVTFAKSALSGPKMHFGLIFRILSPKLILEPKMHVFAQNRLWAERDSILIKIPLVL